MKSSDEQPLLSIGEAAARFGLAPHVLRHWESVGLLAPARAVAGRRRYGRDQLYRIAIILRAKEVGFGLDDIRAIMTAPNPATRTDLLRGHRADLARRIARAQTSLDLIDCALGCEHEDLGACPHFQAILTDRIAMTAAPTTA
ncbi:helix-turn-helix domain-containing protein [Virgisporangium aurantiacum]|nr:MerR family transcriptional regulator [Virgisporangium aurantiacum]